jgi:hypothetical protein
LTNLFMYLIKLVLILVLMIVTMWLHMPSIQCDISLPLNPKCKLLSERHIEACMYTDIHTLYYHIN